jgi:UDP-3-O-[3-hydroxymyristoyl] N-acetylglucosamine deacetylase
VRDRWRGSPGDGRPAPAPSSEAIRRGRDYLSDVPRDDILKIRKPVRRGNSAPPDAEFQPHDGCRFEVGISYDCPVIGAQSYAIDLTPKTFRAEVAGARTFGYVRDVERLWASGFALGSSLDNSVVIDGGSVINPGGLRYSDEFVRHKLLDAIGDIALAGAPIQGLYRSFKGGHKLNALALSTLLARKDAWTLVSAPKERATTEKRIDLFSGILTPAFAPDVS